MNKDLRDLIDQAQWAVDLTWQGVADEQEMARIADVFGVVGSYGSADRTEATWIGQARTVRAAVLQALRMAAAAGVTGRALIGIEAVTAAEYERRLDQPAVPDLVTATEAAEILGVTRQRVETLADTRPDFPRAATTIGSGKRQRLWLRDHITQFARVERPRGRHLGPVSVGA